MTSPVRRCLLPVLVLALLVASSAAATVPLTNWPVPSAAKGIGPSPLADAGYPAIFVPVDPCRLVDTRGAAGTYGGPKLTAGGIRSFDLDSNPTCTGIPAGAAAYSLNFTVTETEGAGFLTVYPTGGSVPTVSTINYVAAQTIANAAVVPSGVGGSITVVAGVAGTHVIIDINGYFLDRGGNVNPGEFLGVYGSFDAGGLIYANNSSVSASAGTSGIRGYLGSTVAGQAVYGDSGGATGVVYGVRGAIDSTTDGAAGVKGETTGTSGVIQGVLGTTASTSNCAAGVRGQAGTAVPCGSGGTMGVRASNSGLWGVLSASSNSLGRGVQGNRADSGGFPLTSGVIGYSGTAGVHSFEDITASGTKSFIEPHPTDASRQIVYVALEGPEAGTYFRGRGRFAGGKALIPVPDDFRLVTAADGLTCQVTPIGKPVAVAVSRLSLEGIEVEATGDVEFSFLVHGVRKHYEGFRPVQENVYFVPPSETARMDPWPPHVKQRLVDVGIYNADGTPNLDTARRLGWKAVWDEERAKEEAHQRSVQEARAQEKAADTQTRR